MPPRLLPAYGHHGPDRLLGPQHRTALRARHEAQPAHRGRPPARKHRSRRGTDRPAQPSARHRSGAAGSFRRTTRRVAARTVGRHPPQVATLVTELRRGLHPTALRRRTPEICRPPGRPATPHRRLADRHGPRRHQAHPAGPLPGTVQPLQATPRAAPQHRRVRTPTGGHPSHEARGPHHQQRRATQRNAADRQPPGPAADGERHQPRLPPTGHPLGTGREPAATPGYHLAISHLHAGRLRGLHRPSLHGRPCHAPATAADPPGAERRPPDPCRTAAAPLALRIEHAGTPPVAHHGRPVQQHVEHRPLPVLPPLVPLPHEEPAERRTPGRRPAPQRRGTEATRDPPHRAQRLPAPPRSRGTCGGTQAVRPPGRRELPHHAQPLPQPAGHPHRPAGRGQPAPERRTATDHRPHPSDTHLLYRYIWNLPSKCATAA